MIKGLVFTLALGIALLGQSQSIHGTVYDPTGETRPYVSLFLEGTNTQTLSRDDGTYALNTLPLGQYRLVAFAPGLQTMAIDVEIKASTHLEIDFHLKELTESLEALVVRGKRDLEGATWLQSVSGTAIYDAKKTELILVDNLVANKAANVGRQVYARVPGLNIWENDAAGINLAIGARGLDPNRTSNFNVRQNGYDISADALGYPESYYTPPVQALERIEIIRGASGLQYGTQFGGLLNFVFKEGGNKPAAFTFSNSIGSFGLYNSFNSLSGSKGKFSYYTFFNYKKSEGWRPNSEQVQHNAFASVKYQASSKLSVKVEHTYMTYLAHQPGGLTDSTFAVNPYYSNRARNWFDVTWNLSAMELDFKPIDGLTINNRSFFLAAHRYAVGNLENIQEADNLEANRNLLTDQFRNFGNELRLVKHYSLLGNKSALVVGNRLYYGHTLRKQGEANNSLRPSFNYVDQDSSNFSKYDFPNFNASLFAENVINITERFSITPGIRYEHIHTQSDGVYRNVRTNLAGKVERVDERSETQNRKRSFLIIGLGTSYKLDDREWYGNVSQNYRSMNFNDIRVVNPSLVVDENISDEFGYNADLGMRGRFDFGLVYDFSLFYLRYNDKISSIGISEGGDAKRLRANIGDAYVTGFESYAELDLIKAFSDIGNDQYLKLFINASVLRSKYISSKDAGIAGNQVELVPPVNIKSGLSYKKGPFACSYLFTFIDEHFSEATNSANPSTNAVNGVIPSYHIMDLSASYEHDWMIFEAGINNFTDQSYFTRRADGYPGPGIIPAKPRSFYLGIEVRL